MKNRGLENEENEIVLESTGKLESFVKKVEKKTLANLGRRRCNKKENWLFSLLFCVRLRCFSSSVNKVLVIHQFLGWSFSQSYAMNFVIGSHGKLWKSRGI